MIESAVNKLPPAPLGDTFRVQLRMVSDWHVGSGMGLPGNIDSLVRRDVDSLPYVPAKTLTGIWRDACERVAFGLDDGHVDGLWSRWVDYLFGDQPAIKNAEWNRAQQAEAEALKPDWRSPRGAVISLRAAHLPLDLRQALKAKPIAREAVTFVKPGIAIHPRTGSARPDFLRFEEMARGGVSLFACCEMKKLREEHRRVATALLIAGAQLVERLGGKRRRGAGRCELSIVGFTPIDPWLDWIESHPRPCETPLPGTDWQYNENVSEPAVGAGEWVRLDLQLTAKLPILIPAGIVGNLIETLDYIPGTYLLPHISRNFSDVNTQAAIARGELIVTNATIEIDGEKGRAVPFSMAYPKTGGGLKEGINVLNLLCDPEPIELQVINHREGYVGSTTNLKSDGRLPVMETIDTSVETHNVVKDDVQRPTEEVGGVYSYEAIPAGTKMRAELRLRSSLFTELSNQYGRWFAKLEGPIQIGRAKKDDYGLGELVVVSPPETVSTSSRGDGKQIAPPSFFSASSESRNQELTVWLLSDLLWRDKHLRPAASIQCLCEALEAALNDGLNESQKVKLTLKRQSKNRNRWSVVQRQRRTDSWHVAWGLPRPSLVGLQAGTCAVFIVAGKVDPVRLSQLEVSGLGERRAEGYGQVSFNDPLVTSELETLRSERPIRKEENELPLLLSKESSFQYARLIESQAVNSELRRKAPGFAASRQHRKEALGIEIENGQSKPRISQLGTFASRVRRLRNVGDEAHVLSWLAQLRKVRDRYKEWPGQSLDDVEKLIIDKERVWQLLDLDFAKLVLTENGKEELKQALWAEAVRSLVDACMRAQKRDQEGEGRDG